MAYFEFVKDSAYLRILIPLAASVMAVLSVTGVIANVILSVSILSRPALRNSPTYLTLLSLAFSDILVLLCCSLLIVTLYTGGLYETLCQLFLYVSFASLGCSSYHLLAFAAIRCLTLTKPLFAANRITAKTAAGVCIVIWLLALGLSGPSVYISKLIQFNSSDNVTIDMCLLTPNNRASPLLLTSFLSVVPLVCMCGLHAIKAFSVGKKLKISTHVTNRRQLSNKVVIGVVVVFIFAVVPSGFYWSFILLQRTDPTLSSTIVAYLITSPTYINSAINPFIYFFFSDQAKKNICQCFYSRKVSLKKDNVI